VAETDQLASFTGQLGFTSPTDVNRLHADHETIEFRSAPPDAPARGTSTVPALTTDAVTDGAIDYVTVT